MQISLLESQEPNVQELSREECFAVIGGNFDGVVGGLTFPLAVAAALQSNPNFTSGINNAFNQITSALNKLP